MADKPDFLARLRALVARLVSFLSKPRQFWRIGQPARPVARVVAFLSEPRGAATAWALLFLVLWRVSVLENPAKFVAMNWLATKIIGAALIGAALYVTLVKPRSNTPLEGLEGAMDRNRMALMMVGAIAAALLS